MSAAAFICWLCQRTLGRDATYYALDGGDSTEVICQRCTRGHTRGVVTRLGDRAKASHVLGLSADGQAGHR